MSAILDSLAQIQGIGQDLAWRYWLVFLRIGAAMALLPAFGEQSVPQRIKLVLAMAFTLVVAPASGQMPTAETAAMSAMGCEVLVGLVLGMSLRVMVMALQIAGAIAANATSLSQLFGGAGPEPQPALANVLLMAGLALALAMGMHIRIAQAFILSFDWLPAGRLPQVADVAQLGLGHITAGFALAFVLAAPFSIAAFLYNVALGVINRAMPALMVSFIGAPALAGGGLALIALVSPILLAVWVAKFNAVLANPFVTLP